MGYIGQSGASFYLCASKREECLNIWFTIHWIKEIVFRICGTLLGQHLSYKYVFDLTSF
jgi:hypothetical protein